MLELRGVSKQYDERPVLRNVNILIEDGLTYGLVGINGAGKTTFMKIVKRLVRSHEGRLLLRGKDITDVDALDVPISFVGDTPAFFPDLAMEEQMLLVCRSGGLSEGEAVNRIKECSTKFHLNRYLDHYPRALSRGTQQRFNVALSFLVDSELYLYDEPFIALDPVQVEGLEKMFLERRGRGISQIVSSHNLDSLEQICDKYLVLSGGDVELFANKDVDRGEIMRCLNESSRALC